MLDDIEKTIPARPVRPRPARPAHRLALALPRPPYFVTNRTARTTVERVTRFTAAPGIAKLPAIFASALRG